MADQLVYYVMVRVKSNNVDDANEIINHIENGGNANTMVEVQQVSQSSINRDDESGGPIIYYP